MRTPSFCLLLLFPLIFEAIVHAEDSVKPEKKVLYEEKLQFLREITLAHRDCLERLDESETNPEFVNQFREKMFNRARELGLGGRKALLSQIDKKAEDLQTKIDHGYRLPSGSKKIRIGQRIRTYENVQQDSFQKFISELIDLADTTRANFEKFEEAYSPVEARFQARSTPPHPVAEALLEKFRAPPGVMPSPTTFPHDQVQFYRVHLEERAKALGLLENPELAEKVRGLINSHANVLELQGAENKASQAFFKRAVKIDPNSFSAGVVRAYSASPLDLQNARFEADIFYYDAVEETYLCWKSFAGLKQ